ncbi:MAG: hypothetical protein EXR71_10455 [Myxococcales bacterium]|nr:hypothetical protein [Myxococcales bacterium]
MGSLVETLRDAGKRRAVVDAGVRVIEQEVADKSGLSGLAIKGTFKVVQRLKPGFVPQALNHLMDDFAAKIDPFWLDCQATREEPRGYFTRRGSEIANALLSITDERARRGQGPARSAYEKLRPEGAKHVVSAMPRLADLCRVHAG